MLLFCILEFFKQVNAPAQTLYDLVFDYVELVDRDYFGLQFFDVHLSDHAVYAVPLPSGYYLVHILEF